MLTSRVIDPTSFDQHGMHKFVKLIKHQDLIPLFETPILSINEKKVKDIFYTIRFAEDGVSLTTMVQRVKFF